MYQIGIDVGGTFTDFVLHNDETGEISIHKMPSTPTDPSRAAIAGIEALSARDGFDPAQLNRVLHGTTIATNIILQRNGARVGMITTEGFRDILHIGRKNRPLNFSNYQDVPRQTAPLVPRRLRLTVPERVRAPNGAVEVPLDEAAAWRALRRLADEGVEAIAVAFLFAFLNPDHENRVRDLAAEECPDVFVTCSHDVSPLHREYERFSTTALNAYVGPATANYTARFSEALGGLGIRSDLRLMTSAGGLVGSRVAGQRPVSLLASGPVGALIKGIDVGGSIGHPSVITLDVGGTSADVGVAHDGRMHLKHVLDTQIGDYDAMVPMVDVTSIGAGGGSIACVDEGGIVPGRTAQRGRVAGAAFVAEIARDLGIPKSVVPPHPGVGAAAGLLSTDIRYEYMASHWADLQGADLSAVAAKYRTMAAEAGRELARDGFADADVSVVFEADCRYKGQGYELRVEAPTDFADGWKIAVADAFHREHERHYLRRFADSPVQLVNIRAVGVGRVPSAAAQGQRCGGEKEGSDTGRAEARIEGRSRTAVFPAGEGWIRSDATVYRRDGLMPGTVLEGPAIVEQEDTTTVVPPDFRATADAHDNLIIEERP